MITGCAIIGFLPISIQEVNMAEFDSIVAWTLIDECPIPDDVQNLLVDGEYALSLIHI